MTAVSDALHVSVVNEWDKDEIVSLYETGGWWKPEYNPEEIPGIIKKSFAFVVASNKKNGQAVGMGRAISDGMSDAYIQDLVVIPSCRGRGIGSRIVSLLIDRCKKAGVTWIAVIAEPDSEEFYKSLGFELMPGHAPMIYAGDR